MTLKQLEYFLAIAETGSMTRAANNLCISQPPLSLQLKSLEEELGVQLFVRDKKCMVITRKGMQFQKKAREILNLVEETVKELQSCDAPPHIEIRIGTVASICNRVLPDKIVLLKKRFPHLSFDVYEGSSTSIIQQLAEGTVDFGIIREPFNTALYHTRPIRDLKLGEDGADYFATIAYASFYDDPEAPSVDLSSLKDKPLIAHRRYCGLLISSCRQRGFTPNIICQNDNIHSSLSWASSGIGIAIAPYTSAIQSTDPKLLIKRIVNPTIISKAFLVWNMNSVLSEEGKALVQLFE